MAWLAALRQYGHRAVVGVAALLAPGVYGYPHAGQALGRFEEEWTALTAHGRKDYIDVDILKTIDKLKAKLQWDSPWARFSGDKVEWFSSKRFDISSRGTMQSTYGGLIGVPLFYSDKFVSKVQEDPKLLDSYGIDLSTKEGKQMFELLKLNQRAKEFSLAKEMVHAKSSVIYVNGISLSVSILGAYAVSVTLSSLIPFPGSVLVAYAGIIPLLSLTFYKYSDWMNRSAETRVIKRVAELDSDIAEGGIEYYDTLIKKENLYGNYLSNKIKKNVTKDRRLCDLIMNSFEYFEFSQYFKEYRKPSLSNVERREIILKILEAQKQSG